MVSNLLLKLILALTVAVVALPTRLALGYSRLDAERVTSETEESVEQKLIDGPELDAAFGVTAECCLPQSHWTPLYLKDLCCAGRGSIELYTARGPPRF